MEIFECLTVDQWMIVLGALVAASEALSLIPQVKSNGVLQGFFRVLVMVSKKLSGAKALPVLAMICILGGGLLTQGCEPHPIPEAPGEAIAIVANDMSVVIEAAVIAERAGLINEELHDQLLMGFKVAQDYINNAHAALSDGSPAGAWGWVDQAVALVEKLGKDVPR